MTFVPVFIQPGSEQNCLLRSNVLPSLGVSVLRTNGQPLMVFLKTPGECGTAGVNLVQATTLPGLKVLLC